MWFLLSGLLMGTFVALGSVWVVSFSALGMLESLVDFAQHLNAERAHIDINSHVPAPEH